MRFVRRFRLIYITDAFVDEAASNNDGYRTVLILNSFTLFLQNICRLCKYFHFCFISFHYLRFFRKMEHSFVDIKTREVSGRTFIPKFRIKFKISPTKGYEKILANYMHPKQAIVIYFPLNSKDFVRNCITVFE